MKKIKNGFTLIEILAVIVILAVLSLIAIPKIVDSIQKSKENLYKEQVNRILEASNKLITEEEIKLPKKYSGFYYPDETEIDFSLHAENKSLDVKKIPISLLQEKGYLKQQDVKNPLKSSKNMDSEVAVYYNYLFKQYDMVYCDSEYYKYYYTEEDYKNRVSIVCNMEYVEQQNPGPDDPTNPSPTVEILSRTAYTDRILLKYHLTNANELIIKYWKENDTSTTKTIYVDNNDQECNFQKCTIKGLETTITEGKTYNFELEAIKGSENATASTSKPTEPIPAPQVSDVAVSLSCPRTKTVTIKFKNEHIDGNPRFFFKGDKNKNGTITLTDNQDKIYDLGLNTPELSTQISTLTVQNGTEVTNGQILADHYYEYVPKEKLENGNSIQLVYSAESSSLLYGITLDESANRAVQNGVATLLDSFKVTLKHNNGTSNTTIYERNGVGFYSDISEQTSITHVTIPTRTGYTFKGYKYNNETYINASGEIVVPNTQFCSDVTLEGSWEAIITSLTLNPNGGTINNSTNNITYNDMVFDKSNHNSVPVPQRQYYTFRGWYTAPTGGTQVYDKNGRNIKATGYWSLAYSSGVWNATNNVVLYANWETNPVYTISFDANGGSGAPSPQTYKWQCGEYTKLSGVIPKKNGYTFKYWQLNAKNGQTAYFNAGADNYSKCYDSDATLIAQWQANTYTITFNANGGTGGPDSQSYTFTPGAYLKLDSRVPTKEGYKFTGWLLSVDGATATYQPGSQTYKKDHASDETLVAQWAPKTNTLTLNLNGGKYNNSTNNIVHGMTYDSKNYNQVEIPSRTGFTFDGWYTQATGGAKVYDSTGKNVQANGYWSDNYSSGVWKRETDTTLYAHWIYNTTGNGNYSSEADLRCIGGHGGGVVGNNIFLPIGYTIQLDYTSDKATNIMASYGECSGNGGSASIEVRTDLYAAFGDGSLPSNFNSNAGNLEALRARNFTEKVTGWFPKSITSTFTTNSQASLTYTNNTNKDDYFFFYWNSVCNQDCVQGHLTVKITVKDTNGNIVFKNY